MTELQKVAIEQLQEDHKKAKYDNKAKIMAKPTLDALINFCKQSEEFAEAVHDSNNTFAECMASVAKGVGNAISDFEAYGKAVKLYMPSAKINVVMEISVNDVPATAVNKATTPTKRVSLNLLDLL